jgi:hypothetical protein
MDWPPQCDSIKERLIALYTLDALEPFLQLAQGQTLPSDFDSEMVLRDITNDQPIASIWLEVTDKEVTIELLQRLSKGHKGVVKDVLYLIICKAIQLDLPITFTAVPSCKSCAPGIVKKDDPEKLHQYYTSIGFTAKETSSKKGSRIISYHTSVNTLRDIIAKWEPTAASAPSASAEAEGGGGGGGKGGRRKTRRRYKTRRKNT